MCIGTLFVLSETIDKQKVLEIIKAAKQHKSVKIDKANSVYDKKPIVYKVKKKRTLNSSIKEEKIVVYRKKQKPTVSAPIIDKNHQKIEYGSLPTLVPSSVELQRKFEIEQKLKKSEILFKSPQSNKHKTRVNTTAIKIKYF